MLLSSDYFDVFVTSLFENYIKNKNYVIKNGIVYSQCLDPNKLPSVFFMFNELWIQVLGRDYMIDISPAKDRSLCQLMFYKNPLAFNVFGTPIFTGYYTTHDPVNNKISFVPTPNSPKTMLQIGTLPANFFDAPLSETTTIWVYVITAVVVVALACLYYFVIIPQLSKVV